MRYTEMTRIAEQKVVRIFLVQGEYYTLEELIEIVEKNYVRTVS